MTVNGISHDRGGEDNFYDGVAVFSIRSSDNRYDTCRLQVGKLTEICGEYLVLYKCIVHGDIMTVPFSDFWYYSAEKAVLAEVTKIETEFKSKVAALQCLLVRETTLGQ